MSSLIAVTDEATIAPSTTAADHTAAVGLRTLVVGLGHAGKDLHLPVLHRLRHDHPELFAAAPPLGCDPLRTPDDGVAATIAEAADLLDPRATVVHLCTPPTDRSGPLRELAAAGFDMVLVEKPLALSTSDLDEITALRSQLDMVVVSQWLTSALTKRIAALVRRRTFGALTGIRFRQTKARFQRSSGTGGHPTAFDVELPHSLGVALLLAGDADVVTSRSWDLTTDAWTLPHLGGSQVQLRHHSGVRTELVSDLGAPVRERSIVLSFEHGTVIGHYPADSSDPYARLAVHTEQGTRTSIFPDDTLAEFLLHAYRYFTDRQVPSHTELNTRVAQLLCEAKEHALGAKR